MKLKEINLMTPEYVSLTFRMAGLGSRATANILDWIFLSVIYTVLGFLLFRLSAGDLWFSIIDKMSSYLGALLIILLFLLWWGYFSFFEFFTSGKTPGKYLAGIQVIQDNGQSITFLSAIIRNLFRIIDFLPIFFSLGVLMIFFHPKYQRIGDIAAGTIVVYQNKIKKTRKRKKGLQAKALQESHLEIDEWTMQKFSTKEWDLLKAYILRKTALSRAEYQTTTKQVAEILLPRLGLSIQDKSIEDIEIVLDALYIKLQSEWEYKTT